MTSVAGLPSQVVLSSADGELVFDAVVTENHSRSLTLTEHPVEEGAEVTDHAMREPVELSLQGLISDYPILLNADTDKLPSVPGGDPNARAAQAFAELERLQQAAALLEITTELDVYTDMVITGISVTRDKDRRHILDVGLTLREYRKAQLEAVDAPEPIEPVHKDRQRGGPKPKKAPATAVEEKTNSTAESAANFLERVRGGG